MTDPIADLNRRLVAQRHNPLGLPPIPAAPVPLWWIFAGWGGYALGLLLFAAFLLLGGF